jgi:hypothetical protein
MTISTFQMRIEMNMVFKTDNHVMPISNRTCIVQIDDLNLAQAGPSPIGALRSLKEHQGWYSCHKDCFVSFENNINIISIYKFPLESGHNILDSNISNLPNSYLDKTTMLCMEELE